MAVNRARKWRLMGDGTGYHISSVNEPGPGFSTDVDSIIKTALDSREDENA
jgi:hypothetical protein